VTLSGGVRFGSLLVAAYLQVLLFGDVVHHAQLFAALQLRQQSPALPLNVPVLLRCSAASLFSARARQSSGSRR
jgi:hypothetical protein